MKYDEFLNSKCLIDSPSGFDWTGPLENGGSCELFPFQKAIVLWALKRGRAAVFADTGLGKTFIEAAWSWVVHQYSGNRVLIFAPLCVAQQTIIEADKIGVPIKYIREMPTETGIFITNYELIDHFELGTGWFDGVVLDESSILKHQDSKTRKKIIEACRNIPYKLSCTATPSPNDFMELGSQSEFLGVMSQVEMLSMFFIHDSGETSKWRLKGHGKTKFWEWLSHWAIVLRKPSDLDFKDKGYILPPLQMLEHEVITGKPRAETLSERGTARRESIDQRVEKCAELVNSNDDQWIVWCNLNDESAKLADCINGAVEVYGSLSLDEKEKRIMAFTSGEARVLVTKTSITGYGLNWQHCYRMAFVGLNDSYEQLYQAIRRCYRFGQKKSVEVNIISADSEGAILDNLKLKETKAQEMYDSMVDHMRAFCQREVKSLKKQKSAYKRDLVKNENITIYLGDCVDVAKELESDSVDYSIFSPPFASLYTYSNSDRDMGNSGTYETFFTHFEFLIKELFRTLKPGRNISLHLMNLPTSKTHHGYIGIQDFRGRVIASFLKEKFIYHSEVCVWKDPVVAMQRTKALGLLWRQIKKDSSMSRQGIPDYVVTFRKPGENPNPISHTPEEFPVALWQELASPCWNDIKQSNTLNRKLAREESDERHIAPLQLDLIERCLFLWSKAGDVVLSPFMGIGSEGYVAVRMGRRFIGAELKESYFTVAKNNLENLSDDGYIFPEFNKAIGKWTKDQPERSFVQQENDPSQMTIFEGIGMQ